MELGHDEAHSKEMEATKESHDLATTSVHTRGGTSQTSKSGHWKPWETWETGLLRGDPPFAEISWLVIRPPRGHQRLHHVIWSSSREWPFTIE